MPVFGKLKVNRQNRPAVRFDNIVLLFNRIVTISVLIAPAGAAAETTPTGRNKIRYKTIAFFHIDTLDVVGKNVSAGDNLSFAEFLTGRSEPAR